MIDMGQKIFFLAKRFNLDRGMIKLLAKIGTLHMGQKGDITLDLPDYAFIAWPDSENNQTFP